MKKLIKKITVAVCIAATSLTVIAATVSAAPTPRPLETNTEVTTTTTTETRTNTSRGQQVDISSDNMARDTVSGTEANKKSFTHWNAFLWFFLSVIVNFVISCWVGNRFYRLARKSTQTSNEIRALRKDIEEKFASTLTDIEDTTVEVMNRNENYSRTDEGISMPANRAHVEMNEEEREMMRKWDQRRITQRIIAEEEATEGDDEVIEEEAYETRPVRRAYQPTRRSSGIEFEDDEDEAYEELPSKKSTFSKATNKAKDFLSNVFPFED